jgi:GlpG protein
MIGTIPTDSDAERFSDYLVTLRIENMVEESASGAAWNVWIENDDDLDRARMELEAFLADPSDPKYGDATAKAAKSIRTEQETAAERRRTKYVDFRTRWGQANQWAAPLTLALIVLSCMVALFTGFGQKMDPLGHRLSIDDWSREQRRADDFVERHGGEQGHVIPTPPKRLEAVRRGEVWRLITPIFLHFGILHLVFNMFWLRDLGGQVELRLGTWRLAFLVLLSAVIPNLAQYYASGPNFGGMSGVVYALFGYVWVKGRYQPYLGLGISDQLALIMMVFLGLSLVGFMGAHVANVAHVVGLLIGAGVAYGPVGWKKMRQPKF